jgi:hypothetical protein
VTQPADGDVEQVGDVLVPHVRSDVRTAKARAGRGGLNDRQQTYLAAIYRADQIKEGWIRRDAAAGQTTPKAEVWRWVSFSEGRWSRPAPRRPAAAGPAAGRGVGLRGRSHPGGAAVPRPDRRPSRPVRPRLAPGRRPADHPGAAAARAGLGVTRAARPQGLLSRGPWGQLVKAARAEQAGKPRALHVHAWALVRSAE